MTRLLLAVAFGLFVLSIGTGASFADGRRDWDQRWDRRSHARSHVMPPRFHRDRWDWQLHRDRWDWQRRGRWQHGFREGRRGWWRGIGNVWYLYPAPLYSYPPPMAVAPVPVPVQPQISVAPYCREFQGDAIINGTNQRFYGTACLQPDGAWHIVP